MATKRRMGPENAEMRTRLMAAVESLLREKGYAALSARNVATYAGVKYPLVFYYFETMDDLLLTTYRRRTQSVLERAEKAFESDHPLHNLWQASSDPHDAALSIEYMAMCNHNPLIRAETIAFGERLRRLVADRLADRLPAHLSDSAVFTPAAISTAIISIGGIFGFEVAMGLSSSHAETRNMLEWCLGQLEPEAS